MSIGCYHCLPRAARQSYKFTSLVYKTLIAVFVEHLGCLEVWSVGSVGELLVLTLVFDLKFSCSGNRTSCSMCLQLRWLFPGGIVCLDHSPWSVPTISFVIGSNWAKWKCILNSCGPWIFHTCFQWDSVSISSVRAPRLLAPNRVSDNSVHASSVIGRRRRPLYHLASRRIIILV
jgi:hypothetical protein